MKTSKFLSMAVLGVGLAMSSCNNEIVVGGENPQPIEGDGYLSMALQFPEQGASTYAEEPGYGDEIKVATVTVVFFDTTALTGTVAEAFDLSPADFTITGTNVKTKALSLDKGAYDVVVLVNKPSGLTFTVGTTTKSAFDATVAVSMANLTASAGFFMTNATGYKRVSSANFQTTESAATSVPVPMKVERAVAKIIVKAKNGGITGTGGSVVSADVKWAVDVVNTEMYWMRKQTNKLDGTMETEADYTSAGRENLYAQDPNFSGHTSTEALKFNRIAVGDITKALDTDSVYVPENTMQAVDQFRNVSTSVVIGLVFVPTGGAFADSKTNGYFTYNDVAIDYSAMTGYIASPATVPATYPGLEALLNANTVLTTASAEYKNDGHTLIFYKNGLSYFNVPIRHFAAQTTDMSYGRYGVVRNNVYQLTINTIKGPGKIAPDPEDWQNDTESYISVDFEIMPWYVREQGIDL